MPLERVIVKGVAQWANLFEPNRLSQKYQIDICQLDKTSIKKLKDKGLEIREGTGNKKNKGSFCHSGSSIYINSCRSIN